MFRLHNVTSSIAGQRKILSLARDYAKRREAFGDAIENHPLHLQTLAQVCYSEEKVFLIV